MKKKKIPGDSYMVYGEDHRRQGNDKLRSKLVQLLHNCKWCK